MNLLLRILRRMFWIICRALPIDENKIVFQSYYGRGYSDNPKYIAEELRKSADNIDFVWVSNGRENPVVPENFRVVRFRGFRYIYEISTAKIWVDNSRKEYCMKKKNQYYMQTWHGGFTLKKVERAVESELEANYVKQAKRDALQTDVMLSNCNALTKVYREDFWYSGEILQKGLPRNDRLFNFCDEEVRQIRNKLGIDEDVHLLLYAPTFRKNSGLQAYTLNYERCCKALEKRFGGSWKIMLRLHPNIFAAADNIDFDSRYVVNASHYPDIQELYMISEFLITDYSSVIFDFALLKRRALFYADDISDYMDDRGFYFSLFDFPFKVCQNNEELEERISSFDDEKYFEELNAFLSEQNFSDKGTASKAAAEWILAHMAE
ncbi:MAG: CDP-glycerol glycerophosphotransferase family protein [Acutalibacteraceae bacterium]